MLLREIQNIIFKIITRNTSIIQIKKKKTIIALDKNIFPKGNLTRKHKSNLLFFFESRYMMLHKGFELTTLQCRGIKFQVKFTIIEVQELQVHSRGV